MEPEIIKFADSIGATEPSETDDFYRTYRAMFRERNYFRHSSGFLVIKLSRSKKPFWGLTSEIVSFLNAHIPYSVIFLRSAGQGWVFSKEEAIANIQSRHWNLNAAGQYIINMPLPDSNGFFGPKRCLQLLGTE